MTHYIGASPIQDEQKKPHQTETVPKQQHQQPKKKLSNKIASAQ